MGLIGFTLDDGGQILVSANHILVFWPRTDQKEGCILELDNGKTLAVIQGLDQIELTRTYLSR